MLQPSSRRLLLDGLRPSGGYRLDRAVGTSYTLDLLALLTAPLAFTFFDWEDEKGRPMADPLALLAAVRRHAQRIHLFCQAGRVKVPAPGQTLLVYLEDSVFEVEAPHKGGVFHPKVWLLRYVATDDGELPWCTTPIEAESSLGPDSHHPIISLSGIPSAVMVLRILHPILRTGLQTRIPPRHIVPWLRLPLSVRRSDLTPRTAPWLFDGSPPPCS